MRPLCSLSSFNYHHHRKVEIATEPGNWVEETEWKKKNSIHIMNHCDTAKKRTWAILTSSPLTSILIPKIPSGLKLSAPYSISFFYLAINSDSIDFCVHCLEGREKSYRGSHSLTLVFKGPGYHPRWITVRFLSLQSLQEAFFFF